MRILVLVSLLSLASSLAAADAIMPYPGDCPPGAEKRVVNHAEACVPMNCTQTDTCPSGSHCVPLCTCWAEREHYGRMPTPIMRDTEIGRCDASGACDEGRVVHRKECQPDTEATGRGASMEATMSEPSPMEETPATPEETTMEAASTDAEGGGCSAAGGAPLLGFGALLLLRRRRR